MVSQVGHAQSKIPNVQWNALEENNVPMVSIVKFTTALVNARVKLHGV